MSEPDELFTLRTLFWLGSYQAAINEANSLTRINPSLKSEKDEFIYRSYLGLGQPNIVLSEIVENPNTPVGLRAVKLLATYLEDPSSKEIAVLQLNEWLSDPVASGNKTLKMMAATLFLHEDNVKEAYKAIGNPSTLEQYALLVQIHLRIDRADLAQKELKTMKSLDDENALTQLASAWVNLSSGQPAKIQEAAYTYDELIDKYGSSPSLLNGLAVAKMHQGQWEEAEAALKEAITKAPTDPDSLSNMITLCHHTQKPADVINRFVNQLKGKAPNHPFVQSLEMFDRAFDRVASTLA